MHLAHAPPRVRDVNPTVDVPLPLEQAVMQAMEKSREHRFATATAFLQALDDAEAPVEASGGIMIGSTIATGAGMGGGLHRRLGGGRVGRVAAALAGVALLVRRHRGREDGRAAARRALVAAPPKPAPPPPDMADRYKKVEGWLEDGNLSSARRALEQALSERPKDGRVRYMLGRAGLRRRPAPGGAGPLPRKRSPWTPAFRGDPVLLSHLDTLIGEGKQADGALDLMFEKIGAPAADLLEKVANEGADLTRRQRAAAALDDIGEGKRVDQVSLSYPGTQEGAELRGEEGDRREADTRASQGRDSKGAGGGGGGSCVTSAPPPSCGGVHAAGARVAHGGGGRGAGGSIA
jgi:hypothetical protein